MSEAAASDTTRATPVTQALRAYLEGDTGALAPAVEAIYAALREQAARAMRGERAGHTLQPTALVHESLLRLLGQSGTLRDRSHFLRLATRAMRQVLIDHARALGAAKRGGDSHRTDLGEDEAVPAVPAFDPQWLDLENALTALEREAPRAAQVAEMHYFAGMTHAEIGQALDLSDATAERDLRFAKQFLSRRLKPGD